VTDKNTWADHAEDLMVERNELLEKVHRLQADRDRWRDLAIYLCDNIQSVVVSDTIASRFPDPLTKDNLEDIIINQ
jgi:hypothetical protein